MPKIKIKGWHNGQYSDDALVFLMHNINKEFQAAKGNESHYIVQISEKQLPVWVHKDDCIEIEIFTFDKVIEKYFQKNEHVPEWDEKFVFMVNEKDSEEGERILDAANSGYMVELRLHVSGDLWIWFKTFHTPEALERFLIACNEAK